MANDGHTIIVFDHRLDYILPLADQVIYIQDGVISAQGTSREVIDSLVDVDIPEVSEIINPVNKKKFLSIDEAESILSSFLA